jgi:TatD DNase family protein
MGFKFTIGAKFRPDGLRLIPLNAMFCETDESELSIEDVYKAVAESLGLDLEDFAAAIAQNVESVFPDLIANDLHRGEFGETDC